MTVTRSFQTASRQLSWDHAGQQPCTLLCSKSSSGLKSKNDQPIDSWLNFGRCTYTLFHCGHPRLRARMTDLSDDRHSPLHTPVHKEYSKKSRCKSSCISVTLTNIDTVSRVSTGMLSMMKPACCSDLGAYHGMMFVLCSPICSFTFLS